MVRVIAATLPATANWRVSLGAESGTGLSDDGLNAKVNFCLITKHF
jgi:hypothetical protein